MMREIPYRLTDHAIEEALRRNIPLSVIEEVMRSPEQIVNAYNERTVYQSKVQIADKLYLVRLVVEETDPLTVVTVYRTSKIEKYWSDISRTFALGDKKGRDTRIT
jgi:hypothetical protein